MIQTSYFANYRKFPEGKKKISISRFTPAWFDEDFNALELAPSKELLLETKDGKVSDEEYTERYYKETLDKLDPAKIAKKYNNCIFLCYEKIGDFCHRHLVSEWLESYGYLSEEIISEQYIAIEGNKDFSDYQYFVKVISRLLSNYPDAILVSGGDEGMIDFVNKYSEEFGTKLLLLEGFGSATVWNRSTMGISFWDGVSINDNVELSKEQDKKLYIVDYNNKSIYLNT